MRVEISDFESAFSPSYQTALSVYSDVTGRKGVDRNTKEGARILAQAMDAGELTGEQLRAVIRNGTKDEKLPNQSLRGIANNWTRYLGGGASADSSQYVFYECEQCGMLHKRMWVAGMPQSYIGGGGGCGCGGTIKRTKG